MTNSYDAELLARVARGLGDAYGRDASADGLTRTLTVLARLRAAVEREPDSIQQGVHDANTCLETSG